MTSKEDLLWKKSERNILTPTPAKYIQDRIFTGSWKNLGMNNKLFVASIAWGITDQQLKDLFSQYGVVLSAKIIRDHQTQRSRGFAFVEMNSEEEARKAMMALNNSFISKRKLVVRIAAARHARDDR